MDRKTEAAYQTILTIIENQYFNQIELETAGKLLEAWTQPKIMCRGETWNTH